MMPQTHRKHIRTNTMEEVKGPVHSRATPPQQALLLWSSLLAKPVNKVPGKELRNATSTQAGGIRPTATLMPVNQSHGMVGSALIPSPSHAAQSNTTPPLPQAPAFQTFMATSASHTGKGTHTWFQRDRALEWRLSTPGEGEHCTPSNNWWGQL